LLFAGHGAILASPPADTQVEVLMHSTLSKPFGMWIQNKGLGRFLHLLLPLRGNLRPCGTRREISLQAGSRPLVLLLVVGGASLLLAAETALVGVTSSFETPSQGRVILALEPDDAAAQHWLGCVYEDTDPAQSVVHLRRATEINPYGRLYWSDLASACRSIDDPQCVDQTRRRLLRLCPMVPLYHLYAAQSFLKANRLDESVAEFRRLLQLDPTYAPSAWFSLRPVLEPDRIFQQVLADSPSSEIKVGYVEFLSTQGEDAAAYRIWKRVAANSSIFPFSLAQPYLDHLIGLGRTDEAADVWHDLRRLGIVEASGKVEEGNLVFNGDFEQSPLNAGFDWRSGPSIYLGVDFSAAGAYRGARCLRVDFTVKRNEEYEPVYQIVPVLPNRSYKLEAYVRSEEITSNTGPCLRVQDTRQPGFPDAVSETTIKTTPWHPVRLYFSTAAETRSVRVSLWRPRGRVYPTEISGSFWLDAVSLQCMDCPGGKSALESQL